MEGTARPPPELSRFGPADDGLVMVFFRLSPADDDEADEEELAALPPPPPLAATPVSFSFGLFPFLSPLL